MGSCFVAIDEHDGPVSIGAVERVGGDEDVAGWILDVGRRWEHVVNAGAMLYPFEIDHVGGEVGRSVALDVVVFVGNEVGPGGPPETGLMDVLGLNWRVIEGCASAFEKGANVIGEP